MGNTITEKGLQPKEEKIQKLLINMRMPLTVKQTKRLIGFVQFFRSFLPNVGEVLMPFYNLLRKVVEFKINEEHQKNFKIMREDPSEATKTTLRLAKLDQQYVILCDSSYHSSGFVLMIEDYVQK